LLAGCSRQKEISGEVFTVQYVKSKKEVVKQAGVKIFFLTPIEHDEFEILLSKKRNNPEVDFTDEINVFLQNVVHSVVSDSDGKFKAKLGSEGETWVLSNGDKSWYFRYVPDGTPLILSDGNAYQR
jgi:hypothetical protein